MKTIGPISLSVRVRTVVLAAILGATSFAVQAAPVDAPAGRPAGFRPETARAAFCASNAAFTGRLTASSSSTTAVARITNPIVYGYISNVDAAWSCTAFYRYSAVTWNTTPTTGTFDWGNLINSTSVACNFTVNSTDYIKANATNVCPATDAAQAMAVTLAPEGTYNNNAAHTATGQFSFAQADCGTYYSSEVVKTGQNFAAATVGNRPGSNCDPMTLDNTGTSQLVTYDATPPTGGSVTVNAGATYTNSAVVTLGLSATDAVSGVSLMRFSNDNLSFSAWQAYATSAAWSLSSGDGAKTVYAQFQDANGNSSGSVTDGITLDTSAPSGSVTVNAGAAYTNSASVTLGLSATDAVSGVSLMRFSNDNLTFSAWQAYATSVGWTLSSGDGAKTVYAQFQDAIGNSSGSVSDAITLDTTAPSGTVTVNAGASYTNSPAVTLAMSATDALSGVSLMRFSNDNVTFSAWQAYATSSGWTLSSGDGAKTVYAQFQDAIGNSSGSVSDGIVVDTTPGTPNPPDVSATTTASVYQAATNQQVFFRPAAASTVTLTGTAFDAESGINYIAFQTLTPATGWTPTPTLPNQDASSPYSQALGFSASAVSATLEVVARNGAGSDSSIRTVTLTADGVGPAGTFSIPPTGTTSQPSDAVVVTWTESDGTGSGIATRSLQRQKTAQTGPTTCDIANWTADGSATTVISPVTTAGLLVNSCYRWVQTLTDRVGNTLATTSGTLIRDTGATLGRQGHNRFESWDLGAGDSVAANVATGNVVLLHPVVSLPIRGSSVSLGLTYNSQDTASVAMGPGWRLNVHRRLVLNGDGTVTLIDADGARQTFSAPVTVGTVTTYTRPSTLYASLVKDTAQAIEFTLTYRDQSKDTFDISGTEGLLIRAEDRFANGVTLSYVAGTNRIDKITDTAASPNRAIDFAYDASNRVSSITDWAYVSGGVVQVGATGSRRAARFFYDGSGYLAGWADGLNTAGSCPTGGSHLSCLVYTGGLLTAIGKTQTVETAGASSFGTTTRAITTELAYAGSDISTVTDAEEQSKGTPARTIFTRPAAGQVKVVRPGTPPTETTYGLVSANDPLGRVESIWRKLGASQIEQRTAYDATYPIEPASITDNQGALLSTPARPVSYTYVGSSMGLVARMTQPLTASTNRTTDYTYNANNDVTQTIVALDGSGTTRTIGRSCYDASCTTSGAGLVLLKTIANYVDGTAGNGTANAEDVSTAYQSDAYGQRTRETRSNYKADGTLLDSAATGSSYDDKGNVIAQIRNYSDGSVTNPGDDITPNAMTGARTDLTTADTYDTAGNRISSADPRRAIEAAKGTSLAADDFITRWTYDPLGQRLSEKTPTTPGIAITQQTSSAAYDELGNSREAADFGGLVSGTESDRAGRPTRTFEDPDGAGAGATDVTTQSTYDSAGRILTAKDRRQVDDTTLGATATAYDELGRVTDSTQGSGSSPDIATVTHRTYDALDRTLTENTGDGTGTAQLTTFTYDLGGRVLTTNDEFACKSATYDYRDSALTATDGLDASCAAAANTRTVTNTYDGLARLTRSEVTSAGSPDFGDRPFDVGLDGAGRQLTAATRVSGTTLTTTFTFDPLDETLVEARADGSTAKTNFDPAGSATDRCYWKPAVSVGSCFAVGTTPWANPPTQVTTTTYDARNKRVALQDASTNSTTTYDPNHNYQIAAFYVPTSSGKEHQTLYAYDSRHRLAGLIDQLCVISTGHACSSTTATGSDSYTYDDNDSRTQVVEANGNTSSDRRYCYDALNRLRARNTATACTTTSGDETYTYDDAGNRLTAPGASFTYSASGQLASCSPSCATLSHDTAGRISAISGWTYEYDAPGRLTKATETATSDRLEFSYDGEGHRTQIREYSAGSLTRTRDLRYQGRAIVEEKVTDAAHPSGTIVRTYTVTETGTIVTMTIPAGEAGAGTYLVTWNGHGDALGLWKENADGTLTLANSYTYGTWGTPATATHNGNADLGFRFLYVGSADVQWDDFSGAGLTYMHARHYQPTIGRFLQPDPSAAETNLYGYAADNPVTNADPSGTYYRLYRANMRRAAWYMYYHGRISYRSYYLIANGRWIYWHNRWFGQTVWFYEADSCPIGIIGGTVGLVAMGAVDTFIALGNIPAAGTVVGEVGMLAVDVGALTATWGMYNTLQQSLTNSCSNIRWKWPWE